jgi:hypothetical protein
MGWESRARELGYTGMIGRAKGVERGLPNGAGCVVLGFPVGGSVTLAFYASLSRLTSYESKKPDSTRLLSKVQHSQGLYVADNRTLLVQRLLETGASWLLQIDTDIEFPENLLETMLAMAGDDKKVLAASVPLGEAFPTGAFRLAPELGVGGWTCLESVPQRPIECDGIATACLLVHREVFEKIADEHGQCWFHHMYLPQSAPGTPNREFKYLSQGEDLAFSQRATRAGFKIWCAHIGGLRHYKTRALSHDFQRARLMALEGADVGVGELVMEG